MTAPKGKHIFGTVKVGTKGQIVIPKEARDVFNIQPGDTLLMMGDEQQGIALVKQDLFSNLLMIF
ncbi:AbrB/MazE/SpoVT family DNA-binding domain-containing protein [Staphylococcus arlettae]|nr:AbrB/MazE/SpoVT family DNA-binding domain-containing protein [Staphylococcus arlettae]